MAITLEAIRAAGGIVHSDGNIFFRDISMLQGLAGAAPALEAPAAPATSAQVQALRRARRALHAIGKTYDDSELRTRALEADEELSLIHISEPTRPY